MVLKDEMSHEMRYLLDKEKTLHSEIHDDYERITEKINEDFEKIKEYKKL